MLRNINKHTDNLKTFCDGIGATAVIYPAALLTSFALGLVNLGIVFFARDIFHASPAKIGWLAGTWALAYTICCVALRPLFSRVHARYLIITSASLMAFCTFAILLMPSLNFVFVLFALYGAAMSMFWPPLMAWLSDGQEGKDLGRRFSRYNIMWSFGSIFSPYVCGWLAEGSGRYPLIVGAVIFIVTAALISGATLVLPKPVTAADNTSAAAENKTTGKETMLRYPAWIGIFVTFFGFGAILSVFPLAAKTEFGISESSVGLLLLVRALFSAVTFFIIGKTVFWHFRAIPMITGQAIATVCFIILCFCSSPIIIALLFGIIGMVAAFSYSVSVFHGVSGSTNRIKRMTIHESTLSLGLICGSAAGGMLYNISSMAHVYAMSAALLAGGIMLQITLSLHFRTKLKTS